jgi:hypothetical protein
MEIWRMWGMIKLRKGGGILLRKAQNGTGVGRRRKRYREPEMSGGEK